MSGRASNRFAARIGLLTAVMLGGLLFLAGALWRIQIRRGDEFDRSARRQSLRVVRVPADRGRLLDRRLTPLARNAPAYSLCVFVEMFRRPGRWDQTAEAVARELQGVSAVIGLPVSLSEQEFTNHVRRRLPLPLVAWTNLDTRAMARFAEQQERFRGMEITATPRRVYPEGATGAHLVGYVGKADLPAAVKRDYDFLLPEWAGRAGLERQFDAALAGRAGRRLVRVDASGFMAGVVRETASEPGRDLVLTLDLQIQKLAERALAGERGAVVILDPRNGDVLAMASAPGFDPNGFVDGLSHDQWRGLTADSAGQPLLNRAIGALYPPGSLFKPVVAAAGLEGGWGNPDARVSCPGYFESGTLRVRCWNAAGHGAIAMRKALEQSCNTYFCAMGQQIGYDSMREMALALGLGARTGIELDGELAGLIPERAWKRRRFGETWREGDTANAAIGQGFLGVTPVQMAALCAALANGGRLYRPRLVRGWRDPGQTAFAESPNPAPVRELNWSASTRETVRGGMRDVVNAPTGTGRQARLDQVVVAAKTGTAEVGRKGEGRKHVWMMAFAPFEAPRYALAMVVEEGESGGGTVGPRIHRLLDALFSETEAEG